MSNDSPSLSQYPNLSPSLSQYPTFLPPYPNTPPFSLPIPIYQPFSLPIPIPNLSPSLSQYPNLSPSLSECPNFFAFLIYSSNLRDLWYCKSENFAPLSIVVNCKFCEVQGLRTNDFASYIICANSTIVPYKERGLLQF